MPQQREGNATRSSPRVSIVVPIFNGEAFLETMVETVLHQSFEDFELILVDDGSTDGSADIVRRAAASSTRVIVVSQENRGLAGARNRGIEESRGEYIAFLDQDDRWLRSKLQRQVDFLDAHPKAAMVSCYSALVDEEGRMLGWPFGGRARENAYHQLLEWDFVSGGSVAMIRRECLDRVGLFDTRLRAREDWDMWIRIARHFPVGTVPRVLVGYTRSQNNMSSDEQVMEDLGKQVLQYAFDNDPSLSPRFRRHCLARDAFAVACFCMVSGSPRKAWRFIGKSLAITPWPILLAPRRWLFVGSVILARVLPARAHAAIFGLAARCIGLRPGVPFASLAE